MPWSDNLTPGTPAYEIAATTNPRVRVVAGPGTGKSFAMKRRVARLLESGIDADAILPVSFPDMFFDCCFYFLGYVKTTSDHRL